jgi:hypothetical protein
MPASALCFATPVPVLPAPALKSTRVDDAPELGDTTWVTLVVDNRPPPEPPPPDHVVWPAPVDFQLDDVLDAIPPYDRDAFVDQYLYDKADAVYS